MPAELSILTRYPCPIEGCKQFFKMKSDYDRHKVMTHGCELPAPDHQELEHARGQHKTNNAFDEWPCQKPNTNPPPTKPEEPEEVNCTYVNCPKVFKTKSEMLFHKEQDPEHDYCRECDVDCKDWEDFTKHKVESPDHICCPVCALDFKSLGGMKRHVNLAHQRDHKLVCAGCSLVFSKAGGLIEHLENGRCRNKDHPKQAITQAKFEDRIKHKRAVECVLNHLNSEKASTGSIVQSSAASGTSASTKTATPSRSRPRERTVSLNEDRDEDGGALLDATDDQQSKGFPPLAPRATTTNSGSPWSLIGSRNYRPTADTGSQTCSYSNVTKNTPHVLENNKENDNSPSFESTGPQAGTHSHFNSAIPSATSSSILGGHNSPSISNHVDASPALTPTAFAAGLQKRNAEFARRYPETNISSGPASHNTGKAMRNAEIDPDIIAESSNIFSSYFWNPDDPKYSAEIFFNPLIGMYCCYQEGCNFQTEHPSSLSAHYKSDDHTASSPRCPGCMKIFKNLTALIQHFESPSIKCRIRKSDNYGRYMDKFTGGFISVQRPVSYREAELCRLSEKSDEEDEKIDWSDTKKIVEHIRRNEPRYEAAKPEGSW